MHKKFEISSSSHSEDIRAVPKLKSRSPREKDSPRRGSIQGEVVLVVGPAEVSEEEKWLQPADPEVL